MSKEAKAIFNQRIPESLDALITQESEFHHMTKTDLSQVAMSSWIFGRVAARATGLPFAGIAAIIAAVESIPLCGDVFRGRQNPAIAENLGWRTMFLEACKFAAFNPEDKEASKRLKSIVASMPKMIREKVQSEVARVVEVSA